MWYSVIPKILPCSLLGPFLLGSRIWGKIKTAYVINLFLICCLSYSIKINILEIVKCFYNTLTFPKSSPEQVDNFAGLWTAWGKFGEKLIFSENSKCFVCHCERYLRQTHSWKKASSGGWFDTHLFAGTLTAESLCN